MKWTFFKFLSYEEKWCRVLKRMLLCLNQKFTLLHICWPFAPSRSNLSLTSQRKERPVLSHWYPHVLTEKWQLEFSHPGTDMTWSLSGYRMQQHYSWLWSMVATSEIPSTIENTGQNMFVETQLVNCIHMKYMLVCDRGNKDIAFECFIEAMCWLVPQSASHNPIAPL